MKCFKCGTEERKLVWHHIRYDPEEVVMCCRLCHRKIHIKVRKENLCPISPKEVHRLSMRSSGIRYTKNYRKRIYFNNEIAPYIRLKEMIEYNEQTGHVGYWAGFMFQKRKVRFQAERRTLSGCNSRAVISPALQL